MSALPRCGNRPERRHRLRPAPQPRHRARARRAQPHPRPERHAGGRRGPARLPPRTVHDLQRIGWLLATCPILAACSEPSTRPGGSRSRSSSSSPASPSSASRVCPAPRSAGSCSGSSVRAWCRPRPAVACRPARSRRGLRRSLLGVPASPIAPSTSPGVRARARPPSPRAPCSRLAASSPKPRCREWSRRWDGRSCPRRASA